MENKKIKNASQNTIDGIPFDSKLEYNTYKEFKDAGIILNREAKTFTLFNTFRPSCTCYIKSKLDKRPLRAITYTPDFIYEFAGYTVVIECKGFANDVYPYKRKLFRYYMDVHGVSDYYNREDSSTQYIFFEIANKKDIMFAINKIKEWTGLI
ncbi:MAG: DUF1064 domain-containing protein [Clostridia bacterium]|nr:DUF1064 domain-containing protein [Clostridia bacterium]